MPSLKIIQNPMSHRTLHELAKFGSGVVAADLATNIWFLYSGLLPITTLGMTVTEAMLWPSVVFDIALLAMLVHYGWNIGHIPALRERSYLLLTGIVFGVVAVAHFAHVLFGLNINMFGYEVPHWLSWTASAVTAYFSYMSLRLATRLKN